MFLSFRDSDVSRRLSKSSCTKGKFGVGGPDETVLEPVGAGNVFGRGMGIVDVGAGVCGGGVGASKLT